MTALEGHRNLLLAAGRIYERNAVDRPKSFNVFTVLRSASDEVNLHSRFLHALLDHLDSLSGKRENLEQFLREVVEITDFNLDLAHVERESNHIDLLVSDGHQAIVIENKIWAGDQDLQMQRYRDALVARGYHDGNIRLLYLTPHGHEPTGESSGELLKDRIKCLSYRDDLPRWLTGCQRRAFDDPGLRESIAQYVRLIRRMTNTDYEGQNMKELKALLLRDDNLVLARKLFPAYVEAEVELVRKFYCIVDKELRKQIDDLPQLDPDWASYADEDRIRKCVEGRRNSWCGLYYRITEDAWLFLGGWDRLYISVECDAEANPELHGKLKEALAGIGGWRNPGDNHLQWRYLDELPGWNDTGEWLHIREANEPSLKFLLSDEDSHTEFAESIASKVNELCDAIKKVDLFCPG